MKFSDITGQKPVVDRLRKYAGSGQLSHSYGFCGPKGIGKRTVADIFARAVLCIDPGPDGACGKCIPCVAYEAGTSPDFVRLAAEEGSIGVDLARYLQEQAMTRPVNSKYKVFIIEDAEKMTEQAQNCLLKMFEEPAPNSLHILTVSYYEALLPTLRSRLARIDFKRNTTEEVLQYLSSRFKAAESVLRLAALYSGGIIGTAVNAVSTPRFAELRENAWKTVLSLYGRDLFQALNVSSFFEANKERIDLVLDLMESFIRDMMLSASGVDPSMLINQDKEDIIFDIARNTAPAKFVRDMEVLGMARRDIRFNINFPLAIDSVILKFQEVRDRWSR